MNFLIVFALVVAFAWLLRRPIHAHPGAFYAIAVACNIALCASVLFPTPRWALTLTSPLMQKGGLGAAFFLLVMWIGVFPRDSRLSRVFRPIRAELSILACILIAGHMCLYLASYAPRLATGAAIKDAVMVAFVVACVLLVLTLLLGITSLRAVKRHMRAHTWKKVQSLAYAFYALVLVHLLLMLGPSAAAGSERSVAMVAVYAVLFGGYFVARIMRAVVDRRSHIDLVETVKDQGFLS